MSIEHNAKSRIHLHGPDSYTRTRSCQREECHVEELRTCSCSYIERVLEHSRQQGHSESDRWDQQ